MSKSLHQLYENMRTAKAAYELAEEAYDAANIAASPFKPRTRIMHGGKEYEIDRVNSGTHCQTSCLAFPVNKDGSVSKIRSIALYSDHLSDYEVRGKSTTLRAYCPHCHRWCNVPEDREGCPSCGKAGLQHQPND